MSDAIRRLVSDVADENARKVLDAVSKYYDDPQRVLMAGTAEALEENNRILVERLLREYPLNTGR